MHTFLTLRSGKKFTVIALVMSILCISLPSCGTARLSPSVVRKLEVQVDRVRSKLHVPGALTGVCIPAEGECRFARGKADVKTGRAMSILDTFRIGSITKTFTASTVLQLTDDGKLALDDPVTKYVKGVPGGEGITLRQLLNHTSGLYNYGDSRSWLNLYVADPDREWTTDELLAIAYREGPYFAPGEGMHYSNTNYVLLGLVVAAATGRRAEQVIKEKTIDRVGLTGTYFPSGIKFRGRHANGYSPPEVGSAENVDATQGVDPSASWTAGAMISNLADLMKWCEAYCSGRLLEPGTYKEQIDMMPLPGSEEYSSYGLGIMSLGPFIGHGGQQPGFNSYMMYYPKEKASIVVFGNRSCETVGVEGVSLFTVVAKALWPTAVTWY